MGDECTDQVAQHHQRVIGQRGHRVEVHVVRADVGGLVKRGAGKPDGPRRQVEVLCIGLRRVAEGGAPGSDKPQFVTRILSFAALPSIAPRVGVHVGYGVGARHHHSIFALSFNQDQVGGRRPRNLAHPAIRLPCASAQSHCEPLIKVPPSPLLALGERTTAE